MLATQRIGLLHFRLSRLYPMHGLFQFTIVREVDQSHVRCPGEQARCLTPDADGCCPWIYTKGTGGRLALLETPLLPRAQQSETVSRVHVDVIKSAGARDLHTYSCSHMSALMMAVLERRSVCISRAGMGQGPGQDPLRNALVDRQTGGYWCR